jgi:hypothetical protein
LPESDILDIVTSAPTDYSRSSKLYRQVVLISANNIDASTAQATSNANKLKSRVSAPNIAPRIKVKLTESKGNNT